MKNASDNISTFLLVLRRLRGTLIALVLIYAISVLGLTLAPGPLGEDGLPTRLSFFHAFYFISYTATTIGFGEIPYAFTDQQRLWVLFCIYMSVVGWAMFIGKLLRLSQDNGLQHAIRASRFARAVRKLHEPFYIVCGYGETGRLICRALDSLGYRVVVIEIDPEQLADIELQSFRADMPYLASDAANPKVLQLAGLQHKQCRGLITLTNNDSCNLAVSITGRLLAPALPVLARAEHESTSDNMASFDTQHIINPFERFASYLTLSMHSPAAYQLLVWLTGLPGSQVLRQRTPPRGRWVLCGYGRFGIELAERIAQHGMPVSVIDLNPPPTDAVPGIEWIQADATGAEGLRRAGVPDAVGVIAATADDVNNLSIVVTARQLNEDVFVIARQNSSVNTALFTSLAADITMLPSEVIAHECLAILTTPMLAPFLQTLQSAENEWCDTLLHRLTGRFGWEAPVVWSVRISALECPALHPAVLRGASVSVGDLLRDPSDRSDTLMCEVLQIKRSNGRLLLLPEPDTTLDLGDELLLVGRHRARMRLNLTLSYMHTLQYVLTGRDAPGGWVWEWLTRRKG